MRADQSRGSDSTPAASPGSVTPVGLLKPKARSSSYSASDSSPRATLAKQMLLDFANACGKVSQPSPSWCASWMMPAAPKRMAPRSA